MVPDKLLKKLLIISIFVFALGMASVIWQISAGSVVMAVNMSENDDENALYSLETVYDGEQRDSIVIPLTGEQSQDSLILESHLTEKKLVLIIRGDESKFYFSQQIGISDKNTVKSVEMALNDGITALVISLDSMYDYSARVDGSRLKVNLSELGSAAEKKAVIISDGAERLAYMTAFRLENHGIRSYVFDTKNGEAFPDQRLLEHIAPDLAVEIAYASSETGENGIKTLYNDRYFIPRFTNVEFADILERSAALSAGKKALGIFAAPEDEFLAVQKIPAAKLVINGEDAAEDYESAAEGIAGGIIKGFEGL